MSHGKSYWRHLILRGWLCHPAIGRGGQGGSAERGVPRAFTILELLVVISIIVIILSITALTLSTFSGGEALKQSARVVQGAFAYGRQLAASEHIVHFLSFENMIDPNDPNKEVGMMTIYKDTDEDDLLNTAGDEQIGEPITLYKRVVFDASPPLFQVTEPYVGFRPDGSLMLPAGVSDMSLNPPTEADIVLKQGTKAARVYIDFEELSGLVRRRIYKEE